jgi:hypothetical protein
MSVILLIGQKQRLFGLSNARFVAATAVSLSNSLFFMPNASTSTVDVSKWANIDGQSLLEVRKHIAAISQSASSPIRLSPHAVSDRFYAVINGMALGHMRASFNTPPPILHSGPTRKCCS